MTPSWFGFRLHFLEESDQDTVAMVLMSRGLGGLNVQVTLKDGEQFDGRLDDAFRPNADYTNDAHDLGSMVFTLLDETGEVTSTQRPVRYEDIDAIGVY